MDKVESKKALFVADQDSFDGLFLLPCIRYDYGITITRGAYNE